MKHSSGGLTKPRQLWINNSDETTEDPRWSLVSTRKNNRNAPQQGGRPSQVGAGLCSVRCSASALAAGVDEDGPNCVHYAAVESVKSASRGPFSRGARFRYRKILLEGQ